MVLRPVFSGVALAREMHQVDGKFRLIFGFLEIAVLAMITLRKRP